MALIFLQLFGNNSQKEIGKISEENDGLVVRKVRKVRHVNCEI